MRDESYPALRAAFADLMGEILAQLDAEEVAPQFAQAIDYDTWKRVGQEAFVLGTTERWQGALRLGARQWLEDLEAMRALRAVIQAEPTLAARMDTLVGATFDAQRRDLVQVVRDLVGDLVNATRSWVFDQAVFDCLYRRLEEGLTQDVVRFIDVVPVLGFTASFDVDGAEIIDGVMLRPMTDQELSDAVQNIAVPVSQFLSVTAPRISRFHQWALIAEHSYPLRTGDLEDPGPPPPTPPIFGDAARSVLAALRLVCGGSATLSRALRSRHIDDLGPGSGTSAVFTPVDVPDLDQPTTLAGRAMLGQVRTVYGQLTHPAAVADRPLNTAVRQIVIAGSRGLVEDRLLNLVTAAEALFLQRLPNGAPYGQKAVPMANAAAQQLTGDPALSRPTAAHIKQLIRDSYQWRNAEVHGDASSTHPLHRLDGSPTDLAGLTADLERLLRHATLRTLQQVTLA